MANAEFRSRLLSADTLLAGLITSISSAELVECVGGLGLDYVIIDTEHGSIGIESVARMIQAARSVNLAALVRVPSCDPPHIGRICDAGADGIVLPHVETATIAEDLVKSVRYPPGGTRGIRRATAAAQWGRRDVVEHLRIEDQGICAIVQVETVPGVAAAGSILSIEGIDAVIVGMNDLSVSMNLAGAASTDAVQSQVRQVFQIALELGVPCGGAGHTTESIGDLAAAGASLVVGDLAMCVAESVHQFSDRARSVAS